MAGRAVAGRLEAWQGVAALVGITLGVVPLVQLALGRGAGLWGWVGLDGSGAALAAALAVVVTLAAVVGLEAVGRRR